MTRQQKGMPLVPKRFEQVEIPISVATILVDGARLSPAFYKQITEADLIDESTGELRGEPLGYFHLHSKTCPETQHRHVLWTTGTEVHLAIIVSPEEDERYQQQKEASQERQERLIQLLALLLGLADHHLTVSYQSERRRKLEIADYTLYVDTEIADHLQRLQLAREQLQQDQQAWQEHEGSDERSSSQAFGQQQREEAEVLLARADQQGVELKHPARDKIEERELLIYSFYDNDDRDLDGPKSWCQYPASTQGDQRVEPLLSWRAKERQQRRRQAEQLATVVEALLPGRAVWLVRVILAERMAQQRIRATRKAVEELSSDAETASLLKSRLRTAKTAKRQAESLLPGGLDPDQVWKDYQREANRFKALTQQWQAHIGQLSTLRQLFLFS
jgi:hypothetical protein